MRYKVQGGVFIRKRGGYNVQSNFTVKLTYIFNTIYVYRIKRNKFDKIGILSKLTLLVDFDKIWTKNVSFVKFIPPNKNGQFRRLFTFWVKKQLSTVFSVITQIVNF